MYLLKVKDRTLCKVSFRKIPPFVFLGSRSNLLYLATRRTRKKRISCILFKKEYKGKTIQGKNTIIVFLYLKR